MLGNELENILLRFKDRSDSKIQISVTTLINLFYQVIKLTRHVTETMRDACILHDIHTAFSSTPYKVGLSLKRRKHQSLTEPHLIIRVTERGLASDHSSANPVQQQTCSLSWCFCLSLTPYSPFICSFVVNLRMFIMT